MYRLKNVCNGQDGANWFEILSQSLATNEGYKNLNKIATYFGLSDPEFVRQFGFGFGKFGTDATDIRFFTLRHEDENFQKPYVTIMAVNGRIEYAVAYAESSPHPMHTQSITDLARHLGYEFQPTPVHPYAVGNLNRPIPKRATNDLIDEAINSAVSTIQNAIGQTDSHVADLFFRDENHAKLRSILSDYIEYERAHAQRSTGPTGP